MSDRGASSELAWRSGRCSCRPPVAATARAACRPDDIVHSRCWEHAHMHACAASSPTPAAGRLASAAIMRTSPGGCAQTEVPPADRFGKPTPWLQACQRSHTSAAWCGWLRSRAASCSSRLTVRRAHARLYLQACITLVSHGWLGAQRRRHAASPPGRMALLHGPRRAVGRGRSGGRHPGHLPGGQVRATPCSPAACHARPRVLCCSRLGPCHPPMAPCPRCQTPPKHRLPPRQGQGRQCGRDCKRGDWPRPQKPHKRRRHG